MNSSLQDLRPGQEIRVEGKWSSVHFFCSPFFGMALKPFKRHFILLCSKRRITYLQISGYSFRESFPKEIPEYLYLQHSFYLLEEGELWEPIV